MTFDTTGDKIIKSIEVAPVVGGRAYTNRTYTTLLALIVIWHQNQTLDGSWKIHLSDIAKTKGIDPAAGKNLRNIRDDLYSLKTTTIDFKSTFVDGEGLEKSLKNISILSDLQFDTDTPRTRDRYVQGTFSKPFADNLLSGKTNLQNLNSILQITTEIGQIIFRYIDTHIFNKKVYEKNSAALFEVIFGFGEDAKRFKWTSRRRRVLEHHLPLLNGKVLSCGRRLYVRLAETSDNTDIKIICKAVSGSLGAHDNRSIGRKTVADEIINSRTVAIQEAVGEIDDPEWKTWVRRLAMSYSDNVLFRAIAEYKETARHSDTRIIHRDKYFTDVFHRTVHAIGAEWIGNCAESCSKRPVQTARKQT